MVVHLTPEGGQGGDDGDRSDYPDDEDGPAKADHDPTQAGEERRNGMVVGVMAMKRSTKRVQESPPTGDESVHVDGILVQRGHRFSRDLVDFERRPPCSPHPRPRPAGRLDHDAVSGANTEGDRPTSDLCWFAEGKQFSSVGGSFRRPFESRVVARIGKVGRVHQGVGSAHRDDPV